MEAVGALPSDCHHQVVPDWHQAAIEAAASALLDHSSATIDTDRGTVTASLKRPRRLRDGPLVTERSGPGASEGSTWSRLSWRGGEARLQNDISSDLEHAVMDLIN